MFVHVFAVFLSAGWVSHLLASFLLLVGFIPKINFIYFIPPLLALLNSCRVIAVTENGIKTGYL